MFVRNAINRELNAYYELGITIYTKKVVRTNFLWVLNFRPFGGSDVGFENDTLGWIFYESYTKLLFFRESQCLNPRQPFVDLKNPSGLPFGSQARRAQTAN